MPGGYCEKIHKSYVHLSIYIGGADLTISYFIGANLTINYFTGGRFDQVILFWGPIWRGPIWQKADLSMIPDSVVPVVILALSSTQVKSLTTHYAQLELCTTIWTRPQAKQGSGLCFLQQRLWKSYFSCHYLIIDQADCDAMLWALWSRGPYSTSG